MLGTSRSYRQLLVENFKAAGFISPSFQSLSLIQGCSISVLAINLLFGILTRHITTNLPHVIPVFYVDDAYLVTQFEHRLQLRDALAISTQFDLLCGQTLNVNKCSSFASTTAHRKAIDELFPDIGLTHNFTMLGFTVVSTKRKQVSNANLRITSSLAYLQRIAMLPLPIKRKQQLVVAVLSRCYFTNLLNMDDSCARIVV